MRAANVLMPGSALEMLCGPCSVSSLRSRCNTLYAVRAVDTRELGVAAVGGGRQMALESTEAAAVG